MRRHGIDPTTPAGRDEAWNYMVDLRARAHADNDRYVQAGQSAQQLDDSARQSAFATLFHDRGLSSDTRLDVDFSIDQALKALERQRIAEAGEHPPRGHRRPRTRLYRQGRRLRFLSAAVHSTLRACSTPLLRLGLAAPADLQMTTFDLSPRVNQHLEAARQRAQGGAPYVLQLPLDPDSPAHQWNPDLEAYWQNVGARIGDEVPAIPSPPGASVRVRAVRVRPAVALSITPRDLNIVIERLAPLKEDDRFDLIIATNVLIYYNAFEQALALANVSAMLRPGGVFLTNYKIAPLPPIESSDSLITSFDSQGNGDTIFVYLRR